MISSVVLYHYTPYCAFECVVSHVLLQKPRVNVYFLAILLAISTICTSTVTEEGIMDLKTEACERLLAQRVETKMKTKKVDGILNRIHVATPAQRDTKERPPCIPEAVLNRKKMMEVEGKPARKLAKNVEQEMGDDYTLDLQQHWILENEEEKGDIIPEIYLGKNIADFIDPDIMQVRSYGHRYYVQGVEH